MNLQARRLASVTRHKLCAGWEIHGTEAGRFSEPVELAVLTPDAWIKALKLGPVADVFRSIAAWSLDGPARRFDAEDWWYRTEFHAPPLEDDDELLLGFDGLATVADVWLNGRVLMHSTNMFLRHEFSVRELLRPGANALVIRFRSLDSLMAEKRPRPRWRAPMVAHQQLRWFRTTLLGRTPGWSPPAAVVGPWGDIWLERRDATHINLETLATDVSADGVGYLVAAGSVRSGIGVDRVTLQVERAGVVHSADLSLAGDFTFHGALSVADVTLWWPHTHGEPAIYQARLLVRMEDAKQSQTIELGAVGFRTLQLDTATGAFSLRVNGVPIFCRGACWTPLDVVSLRAEPQAVFDAVEQARDAGMNMLRVGGTMVYEDDAFFDACDRLGVLVWQEFMFANMDYPEADANFSASVRAEALQQMTAWQSRPSLAVLCGNSEVEQQAAMWGAAREWWSPTLFHTTLRECAQRVLPNTPYWPSSAHGGAFPHQGNAGTTSYYGVGAYLRPVTDARRSAVRFATECLAFANVPEDTTLARMPGGRGLRVHHPVWKERTPRDLNAGWDFEDVRDHYLAEIFGVAPNTLRSVDHDRYIALSRLVTGEVMADVFAEWRRPGSVCGGALVWFLRDLWAGAGWGLVDDAGQAKSCFHAVRRALQPIAVFATDEGGNGVFAHVVNEAAQPLAARLEVTLFGGEGDGQIAQVRHDLAAPARGSCSLPLAQGLEGFLDISYAYRFGPPPVRLVHLALRTDDDRLLGQAFHFPAGRSFAMRSDLGLAAILDGPELVVSTRLFAQYVHLELEGHSLADNDFHLVAGATHRVAVRPIPAAAGQRAGRGITGSVSALNASDSTAIRVST